MMDSHKDIDVVITWVDGNDPIHKQKMQPYLTQFSHVPDDLAGPTRFRSEGEIFYCVASILRFAPFVRTIFLVTDQQNPQLDDFIQENFPETNVRLQIIDHTEIFKGIETSLPVFNSISIESCLYRIPGLSENFVYFNDDFFLIRPVKDTDWFFENKAVAYGCWRSIGLDSFLRFIKPQKNGHKPFGYKDSLINASRSIGHRGKYFYMEHAPQPLKRSIFERFFAENPDLLVPNVAHRFRNERQFNPQALFYLLAFKADECVMNDRKVALFLKPVGRGDAYVDRKIDAYRQDDKLKFCCIESIDMATNADRERLFNWLGKLLEIKF